MKLKFLPLILVVSLLYSCEQRVNSIPTPIKTNLTTPSPSPIVSPSISILPTSSPIPTPGSISTSASVVIIPTSNATPTPLLSPTISATPIPTSTPVFVPLPKTNVILFDTSIQPFADKTQKGIANLTKLTDILEEKNYTVLFDSIDNIQNLDSIDTILILSPSINYSDSNIKRIKAFITQGKKVFVSGEWGGYGGFNSESVNNILSNANLKINQDVIKESDSKNYDLNDEQLSIKDIVNHPVTTGISSLLVYSSASIEASQVKNTKAKIIASSSSTSFSVKASYYKSGFLGISEIGYGKVVAVGDSSFLLDTDTNNNGIANIDEANNKEIILNMLKW